MNVLHDRKKVYEGNIGTQIRDGKTGEIRFNSNTDEKMPDKPNIEGQSEKTDTED